MELDTIKQLTGEKLMTNTMQKLEQLAYFDTGTNITVETVDNSYQDAEFIDVDDVKEYGDGTVRVMKYVLMIRVNGRDLIGIHEDKLLSVTLKL